MLARTWALVPVLLAVSTQGLSGVRYAMTIAGDNTSLRTVDVDELRQTLKPLAPLVIKVNMCGGLTNQLIALVDGIVMGIFQGMQIVLPDFVPLDGTEGLEGSAQDLRPLSSLYNLEKLIGEVNIIYRSYWCSHILANRMRSKLWCKSRYKPIASSSSAADVKNAFLELQKVDSHVIILDIPEMPMYTPGKLTSYRHYVDSTIPRAFNGHQRGLLDTSCKIFNLAVKESNPEFWSLWWRVNHAVNYIAPIKETAAQFVEIIEGYGKAARLRAAEFGFAALPERANGGRAFNFLHLRAEEDWIEHCAKWLSMVDGAHHDNCMNNTQDVASVLVTEGLDPRVPLYVGTGLTLGEMRDLRIRGQYGSGFRGLTEAFTVVTKETIMQDLQSQPYGLAREQWAAVDALIALEATEFVGNSVSTFSAYLSEKRLLRGQPSWHYNGGITPLQAIGTLTPITSLSVPTFRSPLKWVFTIHVGRGEISRSYFESVKVAVLSALHRTNLVPICLTTMAPDSKLSVWLVSLGVRVVHYQPPWAKDLRMNAEKLKHRSGGSDLDTMVGNFLRVDIPIMGILDDFVLYTDVDVMFKSDIDWEVLLVNVVSEDLQNMHPTLFTISEVPKLSQLFPILSAELNDGVMLMNLRFLRTMYEDFKTYVVNPTDLQPADLMDTLSSKVPFSSSPLVTPHNFLERSLDWMAYWEPKPEAKIVHFQGPKCTSDIEPYLWLGEVRREAFRPLLERCASKGDCANLCREFRAYLNTSDTYSVGGAQL